MTNATVFPSHSCTAYEDCWHDGVCHDPQACGLKPHQQYARTPDTARQMNPRDALQGLAPERIFAKWTNRGNGSVSTPASCGLVAGVAAEYARVDKLDALAADNIRLRAALKPFAEFHDSAYKFFSDRDVGDGQFYCHYIRAGCQGCEVLSPAVFVAARAALGDAP